MNAAARTLAYGNVFKGDLSNCLATTSQWLTCVLWLVLIVSALTVVYVRDVAREWTAKHELLVDKYNQQRIQHDQLLVERSMWSAPARIRYKAQQKMGMTVPQRVRTVVLPGDPL